MKQQVTIPKRKNFERKRIKQKAKQQLLLLLCFFAPIFSITRKGKYNSQQNLR